jgi:arylformamidase
MPRLDPAWLDEQYDNRARIPEHPQIFEHWRCASHLARDKLSCRLDLAYGDGVSEVLDVFPSKGRGRAPVLVFIHGGWWRSLDKRDHSFIAPAFVDAGATVVVPNYALCPAVTIETIALQMARALVWTYRNVALHGGDPQRIVVAGHSAGAHLAAMLLCCDWRALGSDLPAHVVRSALSISGVFDLEPLRQTPFLKPDLRLTTGAVRRLSPAGFPAPKGRLVAVVGENESAELQRQTRLIQTCWGRQAVPVCETVTGANHFDVLHALVDSGSRLHAHALSLLGLARGADMNLDAVGAFASTESDAAPFKKRLR